MMRGDAIKLREGMHPATLNEGVEQIIDYLETLEDEVIARGERIEQLEEDLMTLEARQKEVDDEVFRTKLIVEELKAMIENPPKTPQQLEEEQREQQLESLLREVIKIDDYYTTVEKRKGMRWP